MFFARCVGRMSLASFHMKTLTFGGPIPLHIHDHSFLDPSGAELEDVALCPCLIFRARLYAQLTVNKPVFSQCHAMKSSIRLAGILILASSSTSAGLNTWISLSKSQSFPSESNSSDTQRSLHLPGRVDTFSEISQGIHGSLQILIWLPSPTLQMIPCLSSSRPCVMACHVGDVLDENAVSTMLPLGKYFALSSRAHKLSGTESGAKPVEPARLG